MQQTKTVKISKEESENLLTKLLSVGFSLLPNTNEYLLWRAEGNDLSVLMYTSGSLVVQGTGDVNAILSFLNLKIDEFKPHMGSDEVGKGDYFGPLVVACAYLDNSAAEIVKRLGVADSKSLSDSKMKSIYEEIKDVVKHEYTVVSPVEYNKGVKEFKNVSYFLANIHRKTAQKLYEKLVKENIHPEYIVIDQFSLNKERLLNEFKGLNINLVQFHKGESDIAVATASVMARAVFLSEFDLLDSKYDMTFPKGATDVISFGKKFVERYSAKELENVAKISFKTTSKIVSLL